MSTRTVAVAIRLTFAEMSQLDAHAAALATTRSQLAAALFRLTLAQYATLPARDVLAHIRP